MPIVYKVRNKKTGLFSTGTSKPKWTRVGKVFTSKPGLIAHLDWFKRGIVYQDSEGDLCVVRDTERNIDDYEVVSYELSNPNTIEARGFC